MRVFLSGLLLSTLLMVADAWPQTLPARTTGLLEQSDRLTTLRKKIPESVERDIAWTEKSAELPHLAKAFWLRSERERLLVVSVIELEPIFPVWRIFAESGELVGIVSIWRRGRTCLGDLQHDGTLELFGTGLQIGVVADESRTARVGFTPDDSKIQNYDDFSVIELRSNGARVTRDRAIVHRAKTAMKRGCTRLIWDR